MLVNDYMNYCWFKQVPNSLGWCIHWRNIHEYWILVMDMHNVNWQKTCVTLFKQHMCTYIYIPLCSCLGKHIQIAQGFFSFKHDSLEMPGAAESPPQVSPGRVAIAQKSPWHVRQTEHPCWVVQGASCWNNFGRGSDLRPHHASPAMFCHVF